VSYNGTNYTRYDVRSNINNKVGFNTTTPTLFNSNNIYNIFYDFKRTPNNIYHDCNLYIYENSNLLFNISGRVLSNQVDAAPYVNFDLFRDNAYSNANNEGTCYMCAIFRRMMTATEMQNYASMTL
jgi:hypothetical protein